MKRLWTTWIKNILLLIGIAIFVLSACAPASYSTQELEARHEVEAGIAPSAPQPAAKEMDSVMTSSNQNPLERMVIKNANLTIVVPDPNVSMNTISLMADEMGGFVVSANVYQQTLSGGVEVPRASITIRVPAGKLNQALERIRSESGQDPQSESISSQDVTNEYVDLQSRLKNLEAAEAELTQIMQEANRTEDVLAVYNQLVSMREQIEVIKGQIKYYEQSAALSSIAVELVADASIQPIEIGGWKPEGVAKNAIESMLKAMQSLASALIWIVLFLLPVLLVLFIIFVLPPLLILRAWRKRRKNKIEKAETPEA